MAGSAAFTRLTTSRVDASPFLMMVSSTDRLPSACTMFCCTAQPSRTCATSERYTVVAPTCLIGRPLSAAIDGATELTRTMNCLSPSLASPEGNVRFCAFTAVTMSVRYQPSASGSRSTMIWRYLPP